MLMNIGYNMGLTTGILMTLAVLGGLAVGLALARRIGRPAAALARA